MKSTGSFKDLVVWQKSLELSSSTYTYTSKLPANEQFGLSSQMRRAAVSVASNIAEGSRRKTRKDFLQFLYIARGSAAELETQLYIASEVYSAHNTEETLQKLGDVQRLLTALINSLRA